MHKCLILYFFNGILLHKSFFLTFKNTLDLKNVIFTSKSSTAKVHVLDLFMIENQRKAPTTCKITLFQCFIFIASVVFFFKTLPACLTIYFSQYFVILKEIKIFRKMCFQKLYYGFVYSILLYPLHSSYTLVKFEDQINKKMQYLSNIPSSTWNLNLLNIWSSEF